jgi:hypothetical protein
MTRTETCRSRREVLTGASALAIATAALRMQSVLAADGTPVATPTEAPSWLFTQTFREGDWETTGTEGAFALHLRGGLASTVGFTDRPNRDVMLMTTNEFIPMLWDSPDNPPNAAIIVEDAGTQYTFLLVLTDPVYDEAADQITYTARVLESYTGDGLGATVERVADGTLPQTFGAGALFIDSFIGCGDNVKGCRRFGPRDGCTDYVNNPVSGVQDGHLAESAQSTNTCHYSAFGCNFPCDPAYYNDWCNTTSPDWCFELSDLGCIFLTDSIGICEAAQYPR